MSVYDKRIEELESRISQLKEELENIKVLSANDDSNFSIDDIVKCKKTGKIFLVDDVCYTKTEHGYYFRLKRRTKGGSWYKLPRSFYNVNDFELISEEF